MQEQSSSPPMRAAIDIGSNTIHIVVARCKPDDLDIVEDQLELVRIGESVTTTGVISPEKCDATVATLRKFEALARQHNAEPILVVATEAIRQAHNSQQFLEHIQHQTGLLVHLISGTAEATLTSKRSAASCRDAPISTASITRSRRSAEYDFGIARLRKENQCPQTHAFLTSRESPRFKSDGNRFSAANPKFARFLGAHGCELRVQKRH